MPATVNRLSQDEGISSEPISARSGIQLTPEFCDGRVAFTIKLANVVLGRSAILLVQSVDFLLELNHSEFAIDSHFVELTQLTQLLLDRVPPECKGATMACPAILDTQST
jgi:hypothetical protein